MDNSPCVNDISSISQWNPSKFSHSHVWLPECKCWLHLKVNPKLPKIKSQRHSTHVYTTVSYIWPVADMFKRVAHFCSFLPCGHSVAGPRFRVGDDSNPSRFVVIHSGSLMFVDGVFTLYLIVYHIEKKIYLSYVCMYVYIYILYIINVNVYNSPPSGNCSMVKICILQHRQTKSG
jgi:hypothetical protein